MNNRRKFVKQVAGFGGLILAGIPDGFGGSESYSKKLNKITLSKVSSDFEREPLIRPFGFKGGYMSEIWQAVTMMESQSGIRKTAVGTQSVLWSDAKIFANNSDAAGNALMFAMTNHAMEMIKGHSFADPIELLDDIYEDVYAYGKTITSNPDLRKTFALNALVAVDNAAWLLYAEENNIQNFDDLIPDIYKPALSYHHKKVASIPLMAYSIPIKEIKDAADQGYFFMKIKIGQPGTQGEMLQKDMERLSAIHKAIGHYETAHTKNGKLPYYFDANGRYQEKETLLKLLEHAKGIITEVCAIPSPNKSRGSLA